MRRPSLRTYPYNCYPSSSLSPQRLHTTTDPTAGYSLTDGYGYAWRRYILPSLAGEPHNDDGERRELKEKKNPNTRVKMPRHHVVVAFSTLVGCILTASLSIWTNATLGIHVRRPNSSPAGRQPGRQSLLHQSPRSLKVAPIHPAPAIINTSMTCQAHNSPNSPSTPGTHSFPHPPSPIRAACTVPSMYHHVVCTNLTVVAVSSLHLGRRRRYSRLWLMHA